MMRPSLLSGHRTPRHGVAGQPRPPAAGRPRLPPAVLAACLIGATLAAVAALAAASRTVDESATPPPPAVAAYPAAAPDRNRVVLRADGTLAVWEPAPSPAGARR